MLSLYFLIQENALNKLMPNMSKSEYGLFRVKLDCFYLGGIFDAHCVLNYSDAISKYVFSISKRTLVEFIVQMHKDEFKMTMRRRRAIIIFLNTKNISASNYTLLEKKCMYLS